MLNKLINKLKGKDKKSSNSKQKEDLKSKKTPKPRVNAGIRG